MHRSRPLPTSVMLVFASRVQIGLLTSAGMTDLIEPAAREVLPENPHVLAVGAPRDVKRIADDRHGADQAVHRDIRDHARNDVGAGAELMRLVDDP